MKDFGQVTPRMKRFRDRLIATQSSVCTERARLTTEAYRQYESMPLPLKRALMLRHILSHMTIFIEEETLIVGNQAKVNRAAPIFPEYAMDWVAGELDQFDKRDGDLFTITEEDKEIIREIYPFWKGRTLQDKAYQSYPPFARAVYDLGIIRNEGNITSGDAHLAVDYETVLQKGLIFLKQRTEEKLRTLRYEDPEEMKKSYFYEAVLIVIEAVDIFARRFADLAEEQAMTASPARAAELREIAEICRKVPMQKADSFHEAIQSVWFLQLILQIESNGHSLSFGRFDRYMYPFYEKSIGEGTPVSAIRELLDCLWIKTLTINKVRSARHSKFQAGLPMYQNVTIGGSEADGSDTTNPLSFEVLHSVARMKLTQPNLTVRYHRNLNNDFFMDCLEVVALGFGMPAFNSDEI
ncbi:MAG: formate C-acetyltransferase/glycerol dehydratase family glycyl radical enzyme, partial [Clostridia bacterium]|nr:formate C-acetyltransferase/glycerol dehydratase family glycyl radical enzyme [Clostridia bacterium]